MGYWVQNKKRTSVQRTSKLAIHAKSTTCLEMDAYHFVLVINQYFFLNDFLKNALVKKQNSPEAFSIIFS